MAHGGGARPIAVYGALVANGGIAIAKFVAAAFTGSSAMLAEGIHSVVDTANQVLLLVGINRSRKPADELHQFGHGKELYFWTLVVAIILFGVGGGLAFYEGVQRVLHPHPLQNPIANYIVLAIALVLEGGSWTIALREAHAEAGARGLWRTILRSPDASVVAILLEGTAALLGLIAAFAGVLLAHITGDPRFDGMASIVIGVILTVVALFLVYESRGLVVGERVRTEVTNLIRRVVLFDDGVAALEEVKTMHLGAREVLVAARIRFKSDNAAEVAAAIGRVKKALMETDPRLTQVTIEPVAAPPPPTEAPPPAPPTPAEAT